MSKTLKDILNKKKEQDDRNNRPKVDWFSLKPGESMRVQFLQELGDESPTYDKSKGAAVYLVEHVSPYNFRRKAECSMDREGQCFACEKNQVEKKLVVDGEEKNWPWAQKTNMYIQLVTENDEVKVLSRPAPGPVFDYLYEYAEEENGGSLTGKTFKVSKGPKKNDSWVFTPTNKEFDVPDAVEIVDLAEVVGLKIDYAEQKNFYIPQEVDEKPDTTEKQSSKSHTESEW